ncbi:MAG: PIN domain-containing protein [Verrucomicrobia bacterium]|nr:PIN domain-containing protein [Verrucomicrobiota bacterium]
MDATERKVPAFADTNVWLYALLATQDAQKSAQANALVRNLPLMVSTQLINEVCVNLIRKAGFSETRIQELLAAFYARHVVIALDQAVLLRASHLRARYQFSFWDGVMVASALAGGARVFYSEDLHDGLMVESALRIENPFRSRPVPAS